MIISNQPWQDDPVEDCLTCWSQAEGPLSLGAKPLRIYSPIVTVPFWNITLAERSTQLKALWAVSKRGVGGQTAHKLLQASLDVTTEHLGKCSQTDECRLGALPPKGRQTFLRTIRDCSDIENIKPFTRKGKAAFCSTQQAIEGNLVLAKCYRRQLPPPCFFYFATAQKKLLCSNREQNGWKCDCNKWKKWTGRSFHSILHWNMKIRDKIVATLNAHVKDTIYSSEMA